MFGSSNPFGSTQTPLFGNARMAFGAQSSSLFGSSSTPAFGASSTAAFGSVTTPAFGSNTIPAFGFNTIQAFGSTISPAFGASSNTAFGSTTSPAFGKLESICAMTVYNYKSHEQLRWEDYQRGDKGGQTPTPTLWSPGFGQSTFGSQAGGSRVAPYTATPEPDFSHIEPAGKLESICAMTVYNYKSHEQLRWEDYQRGDKGAQTPTPTLGSHGFGQSNFGSQAGGSRVAPYTATLEPDASRTQIAGKLESISAMTVYREKSHEELRWEDYQRGDKGAQTPTPILGSPVFGQSTFGSQAGGSRVAPYTATLEPDASRTQIEGKLESISAMTVYKDKSHEELRWEDYQRGDKGGPNPAGQSGGLSFPTSTQANPFGQTSVFGQTSAFGQVAANPFSSITSSNPFAPKTPAFGSTGFPSLSTSLFSSPFFLSSARPFGSAWSTPSLFGAPTVSGFASGTSSSIFGGGSAPAFSSLLPIFGSSMVGSTSSFGPGLTFGSTRSSGLFSLTPSIGKSPSPFGQSTGFQQSMAAFGSSLFSAPSTGFGASLFSSSTPSLSNPTGFGQSTPSLSIPFQPSALTQTSNSFSFSNFGQPQTVQSGGFGGFPSTFDQGNFGQSPVIQPNIIRQPTSITNPFGTLPVMPQMSIGRVGSFVSTVQYKISSMPVSDKPDPVSISSFVAPRHLSQRRFRLPVPFVSDDEVGPSTSKDDEVIVHPIGQWPSTNVANKQSLENNIIGSSSDNGNIPEAPSAPFLDESHSETPAENGHAEQ